jgi:hypothetical protein
MQFSPNSGMLAELTTGLVTIVIHEGQVPKKAREPADKMNEVAQERMPFNRFSRLLYD